MIAQAPIVIGWAFDSKGTWPCSTPCSAAAKVRVGQINARGGVMGRPLRIDTCDTNNNNPAKAKSCGAALGKGVHIMFVTCDVDFATPVVQEALKAASSRSLPASAPTRWGRSVRHGRQDGLQLRQRRPGRGFRDGGVRLAQGLADGEPGHEYAARHFKNVVQAFDKRFTQLGGKIAGRESYATGANNVNAAVSRLNARKADVIVTATAFGELPALVSGLRSLGNKTPILNSWAGDGTYWLPKSLAGDRLLRGHVCVRVRGRPEQGRARTREAIEGLHRRVRHRLGRGRRRRDRDPPLERLDERRHAGGDDGEVRGRCRPSPGLGRFSPQFHTVFGRQYRVIKIHNNKARYVGAVTAKVVPKI